MSVTPATAPPAGEAKTLIGKARQSVAACQHFFLRSIWEGDTFGDNSLRGNVTRFLRILFLTIRGSVENGLLKSAAALSFSSLLGLGPLIAFSVLISGALLDTDPATQIKQAILFVAPSMQDYMNLEGESVNADGELANALDILVEQLVAGTESMIAEVNTAGSGIFGLLGLLVLLMILIQLLTGVEKNFNSIWGVRAGRRWSQRVVFYWTFISLGAILGVGGAALFNVGTVVSTFELLPFGETFTPLIVVLFPLVSLGMVVLLLSLGYIFFPNTQVRVIPAFVGAAVAALLLFVNNYLSFFYIQKVINLQSLYGSFGILPVMMFGLYLFWLIVLIGGQLTYATQNVDYLARRQHWEAISPFTRETLTLAAFLHIARRFLACGPPWTADDLSQHLGAPNRVLNESLQLLEDWGWLSTVKAQDEEGTEEVRLLPARPLSTLTLADFHRTFVHHGNDEGARLLRGNDPVLDGFMQELSDLLASETDQRPLDTLLRAQPTKETAAS